MVMEELIQLFHSIREIIETHHLNEDNLFTDLFQTSEVIIHQYKNSDHSMSQEIKIQQLNELLITEVCKKKLLEEELEKERRQRDEYITDVIAQFEKEVRQNYNHLKKKKNSLEEKLSIASEQRLVLIKEVKSLSTELDDVYHGYDSLISMNIKLEENIKSLQQYILELYKEIHLSNPFEERKAETSLELQEMESPKELLLSSDITHNLGDITQYSFSPHMITLFEETYRTLESSAELRLQKRDSLHVSESRNSTRIIQEESELNEQLQKDNIEDDETLSKNSLFGKMLNLDPSSLLESLRNNTNPSNQPSATEVSRRLRSASLTLSTASQGLISSFMNTSQSQSEKGVHSSPPSDTVIEDHHSNHSPPISSHIVYYCSKCHGTVEGPKYSTCTCAVPSLQTEPPSSSSTHSLHHNFWKGISDTKNIFNAAVNMFQKRKSGNFDQSHSHEAVPLHTETSSSSVEKIKSPSKVDSDDEYEESATTLTTTVASVFPNVSDTKEEPLILNENTSNTEEYPANPQLEDSSSTS